MDLSINQSVIFAATLGQYWTGANCSLLLFGFYPGLFNNRIKLNDV